MFEKVLDDKGNEFYNVDTVNIETAQDEMGVIFPKELVDFYKNVGYGFLKSKQDYFNRLMGPGSVCDFRLRKGQFANDYELDTYDEYEKDKLIFFEICEENYLSIGFTKDNMGNIFYGKDKIADSLDEFLTKYLEDERYFD